MAEAAVSFVLGRLADMLNEIEFHTGVHKEVKRLQDELMRMRCFLRDADAKQDDDERVRNWSSDIRNVAYDAEDLIDTFIFNSNTQKKRKNYIKRCISYLKERNRHRSRTAKDLAEIRLRLQDISVSRETYGIKNIGEGMTTSSETLRKLRRSSPRGEERDIIGLEDDTAKLAEQLVHSGDRWSAVSIVGMGGIGKTTLARKVYNHAKVRARFPSRAWIYVSQEFSARDILQQIVRQIASARERLEILSDEELEEMLYNNLRQKQYLVVLDDVWSTKDWDSLAKAFPVDKSNGSRLLLTTRNRNVSLHVDPQTVPHDLQFLNKENSWELFLLKAFIGNTHCSPLLEEIGREIVERCAGLPLAIIVIGGLLSRKRKPGEWERVLNNMDSLFARDPTGVSAILALSYNDLPYYLKYCFLHLGHFPEDYLIPAHKLFRLWIAEGLIPHQEERMEDVAEDYLNELIERNMVQVARMSVNERVKHCRLHDLLRDLSISKAKIENFLELPGDENATALARTRRHPIYSSSHVASLEHSTPHLRSLLFFRVVSQVRYKFFKLGRNLKDFCLLSDTDLHYISRSFKLLRILDLEGISCSSMPSTIGQLIHLKYLGLKQTNIQELPSTIGYLRNLQTLDIAGNLHLRIVPNVIRNMRNLRHLYMCGHKHRGFLQIDTLKHLQVLSEIHIDRWMQNNSGHLTSLQKLGLRGNFNSGTSEIFISIAALLHLQSLNLRCEDADFPALAQLASLQSLVKLHLRGAIRQLPSPHEFPPNLSQITLEHTLLEQGSIEILKKLPKLLILRLKAHSYCKEKLNISATGFVQLEFLEFNSLESLEELNMEEDAMPELQSFRIINCKRLKMLPEEIKSVTALHELDIEEMPKIFVDRLQGEDLHKVQHIPLIMFI